MDKTLNTGMLILNGVSVIDPSVMEWGLQDVSPSDAGRDETVRMHKMRIGQLRTYKLAWKMIDPENASIILKAINEKDNFWCTMHDVMDNAPRTGLYYVGDRTAPFQQWIPDRNEGKIYTQLAFNLIEVMPESNKESGGTT